MTNEEKAEEIAKKHMPFAGVSITECIDTALEMAEWMKSYMIEKTCDWLESNLYLYDENYRGIDSGNSLVKDFKKAMEEDL